MGTRDSARRFFGIRVAKFRGLFARLILGRRVPLSPADVAVISKANTREAYDRLWQDQDLVQAYLEPARLESYMFVVRYALSMGLRGKVVDIGFGSGDFLRLLVEHAPSGSLEVHGLDYTNSAVRRAAALVPEGRFISGDIYCMPYPEDFFDCVFCIQTLEHLKDPEKAMSELDRVCRPGGVILISIPNGAVDDFEGHVNFWSEDEFERALAPREIVNITLYNGTRAIMACVRPYKSKAGRII